MSLLINFLKLITKMFLVKTKFLKHITLIGRSALNAVQHYEFASLEVRDRQFCASLLLETLRGSSSKFRIKRLCVASYRTSNRRPTNRSAQHSTVAVLQRLWRQQRQFNLIIAELVSLNLIDSRPIERPT